MAGPPRRLFFQDGPVFLVEEGGAAQVARYPNGRSPRSSRRSAPVAVAVVGPHPEATPDWFTDSALPVQGAADLGHDLIETDAGAHRGRCAVTGRILGGPAAPNEAVSIMQARIPALPGIGTQKPRLIGIDVTRGLALLGMIAVHALFLYDESYNPTWVTRVALGTASATFAVLAGVGLSLTTGRAKVPKPQAKSTAAAIAARAAAVAAIGLALGYTDAEVTGVILPYYAMLFLLAIPLLLLRTRWVVLIGLSAAIVVPVVSHLVRPYLPLASLENLSMSYVLSDPMGALSELLLTGAYPALPWMSYICAGLVIGRMKLSAIRTARRLLGWGVVLALGCRAAAWLLLGPLGGRAALQIAGLGDTGAAEAESVDEVLTFGFDGTTPTTSWWWLATPGQHAGTPLDLLGSTGVAVAVLGAMLLLGHIARPALARTIAVLTAPLAAAGAMTLTLYTAHVAFMNSDLDVFGATDGYVIQVMVGLLFALGWRQAVGRGPLETLVTAVSNRARSLVPRAPAATLPPATALEPVAPAPAISPRAPVLSAVPSAAMPPGGRRRRPGPAHGGSDPDGDHQQCIRPTSNRAHAPGWPASTRSTSHGSRARSSRARSSRTTGVPAHGRETQVSTPVENGEPMEELTLPAEPVTDEAATPAPKHLRDTGGVRAHADDPAAPPGDHAGDDGSALEQLGITVQRSSDGGRHRR